MVFNKSSCTFPKAKTMRPRAQWSSSLATKIASLPSFNSYIVANLPCQQRPSLFADQRAALFLEAAGIRHVGNNVVEEAVEGDGDCVPHAE